MCDTKFSIYLYSVRFGIRTCTGGYVSLGISVVGVFKREFGIVFFSRRVTSAVYYYFFIHVSVVFFVLLRRISIRLNDQPVSGIPSYFDIQQSSTFRAL